MYFKLSGSTTANNTVNAVSGATGNPWWVNFQPTQNEFWFADIKPEDLNSNVMVQGTLTQFAADGITPLMTLTMYVPILGSTLASFGGTGGVAVNITALNTFLSTIVPFNVSTFLQQS